MQNSRAWTDDKGRRTQAQRASVLRLSFFLVACAVLLLVALPVYWLTLLPPRTMTLDVGTDGAGDTGYLRGVYSRERVETRSFRWLRGDAEITLPVGQVGTSIFAAEFHSAPQPSGGALPLRIHVGPRSLPLAVPEGERSYRLLLPADSTRDGVLRLRLDSPTITPPGDDRSLALALDQIRLTQLGLPRHPALPLLLAELLVLAALLGLLRSNGAAQGTTLAVGLGFLALTGWLNLEQRLWIGAAAWPLALAGPALWGLSVYAQGRLRRGKQEPGTENREAGKAWPFSVRGARSAVPGSFAHPLWLITLAGLSVRLVGVLAPGFEFRDLDIQLIQFEQVVHGQLYLTVRSHEWGGVTFYPPGPYLLALPLLALLPNLSTALYVGAALVDALGPPLLALIARALGARRRTALLAAALLACLPIQFTAIWWGFFTNIAGQTMVLLLVLALLHYLRRPALAAGLLLMTSLILVLLSHVGVMLLTGVMLALFLAGATAWLVLLRRDATTLAPRVRGLLLVCGGVALFFAFAYLSVVTAPMLVQAEGVFSSQGRLSPQRLLAQRAYIREIVPVALWRGLLMLPALALLPGLALLRQRARLPLGTLLLVCWAVTPLLFFLVEYAFVVQVRYIYFAAPLSCLALAALLDPWSRSRAGRVVLGAILLLFLLMGGWLWFNGAILGIKPSLVPLTH